ncbi:MAG TPA: universal stress protein [Nitrososphaeraceae archaeon]|jgi:nucleotide-binding universal stress UspA family protein
MGTPQKDDKPVSSTNTIESKSEPLFQVPQFHKILVPYDGSKMSDKALSYATYLSKISASDIFILNVIEKYSDLKMYCLPRLEQNLDRKKIGTKYQVKI